MAIRDLWEEWRRKVTRAAATGKPPPNRPTLRWMVDVYLAGRRVFKAFPKRPLAEAWIARQKTREIDGELGIKEKRRIGFRALTRRFLEEKEKQRTLATFKYYLHIIRPHLAPFFGDTLVDQIGRDQVVRYIHKRLDTVRRGERLHPRTVNKEIVALRCILRYAKMNGYHLPEDPTAGITALKAPAKKKIRFLSDEEVDRFLNVCPPEAYTFYLTAVDTGLRRKELRNLRWDDIDTDRGVVCVRQRASYQTKSHEDREVPMTARLREHLAALPRKREGLVLTTKPGVEPPCQGSAVGFARFMDEFKQLVKKSGVGPFTLHDLRHTFASRLVMRGVDIFTVSKLLGHKDVKTTQIYAHLAPEHLKDAIRLLDAPRPAMLSVVPGGRGK